MDAGLHRGEVAQILCEEKAAASGDNELVTALESNVGRTLSQEDQLGNLGAAFPVLLHVEALDPEAAGEIRHDLNQRATQGVYADERDLGVPGGLIRQELHADRE